MTAARLATAPYVRGLGLLVEDVSAEAARVRVPYKDENSNPGRALHGGVAASTIGIAGALAAGAGAEATSGLESGTVDLAVVYLAAAIGEDIVACGRVLRRGKEITYVDVAVHNDAGKPIAHGLVTHRTAPVGPADRVRQWAEGEPATPGGGELPPIAHKEASASVLAELAQQSASQPLVLAESSREPSPFRHPKVQVLVWIVIGAVAYAVGVTVLAVMLLASGDGP